MLPAVHDIQHYRGDAFYKQFKFLIGVTPEDLTGQTIVAQCRDGEELSSKLLFTFTVASIYTDGIVTLTLLPAATKALAADTYYWDLQIGDRTRVGGSFEIVADISRV